MPDQHVLLSIRSLGHKGWVQVDEPAELQALIKVEERDGRVAIVHLILTADAITLRDVSAFPLSRIEAALNRGGVPGAITPGTPREVAEEAGMFHEEVAKLEAALDEYLARKRAYRTRRRSKPPARPKLARPDGTDPDGFARRVAAAYDDAAMVTAKPVAALAEEAGVPIATVRRWILEARRRGYLRPARRGRAG